MLTIWYNYCVQVFKLASLILLITVFKKRKKPNMIYLLCSRTLDAKQQPSSVQFFFSFSIIEAVGLFYTNYCVSLRWTPSIHRALLREELSMCLPVCSCAVALACLTLCCFLDLTEGIFFLLRQSSLVAKWFKQLHCREAQRSYYCVCLGGRTKGEIFGCCWCRLLTCHLPDREKKKMTAPAGCSRGCLERRINMCRCRTE